MFHLNEREHSVCLYLDLPLTKRLFLHCQWVHLPAPSALLNLSQITSTFSTPQDPKEQPTVLLLTRGSQSRTGSLVVVLNKPPAFNLD